MSFMRTLVTLAAGYAAAKGVDGYRKMGGMAGLQEKTGTSSPMDAVASQMGNMMQQMGLSGGAGGLDDIMKQFTGGGKGGDAAMAGLGGLMSAFGGAMAGGATSLAGAMDAMTGTTGASHAMEENAKLMIRAMIQAAKADGEIDAEEQAKIMEHLGDVSDEERAFVEEALAAPVDVPALIRDTNAQAAAQVYAMSAMAMRVDTPAEAQYLDALAAGLGIDTPTRQNIHDSMGLRGIG